MHIVIGIITAIAGLIWALNSLQNSGVNLNAFNPFTWARRRKWEKMYGTKPIHNLMSPLESAAVLIVGIAKEEGEISREQKADIIRVFEKEFNLHNNKAVELFGLSIHMIKDEINLDQSIVKILEPSKSSFTAEQVKTLFQILHRVSTMEGQLTESQENIINAVQHVFPQPAASKSKWH